MIPTLARSMYVDRNDVIHLYGVLLCPDRDPHCYYGGQIQEDRSGKSFHIPVHDDPANYFKTRQEAYRHASILLARVKRDWLTEALIKFDIELEQKQKLKES